MKKGLTLVEILTTSLIMSIVFLSLTMHFIRTSSRNEKIMNRTLLDNSIMYISNVITEDVMKSSYIKYYDLEQISGSDTLYNEIRIFNLIPDSTNSYEMVSGYRIKESNSKQYLYRLDESANETGEVVKFAKTSFHDIFFYKKGGNNTFLSFKIGINLEDKSGNIILSSGNLLFYAECRN